MLRDKQKRSRSSYVTLTLSRRHIYELTSLEEHRAFFDKDRPLLEPTISHHEVFPTITPDKTSNFGQSLKVPGRVNWIKGDFEKYDKNSAFGLLAASFTRANLPRTNRVL